MAINAVDPDALSALGFSEEEFELYETLLEHPGITLADIAHFDEKPPAKVEQLVAHLVHKGLVVHSPERYAHYRALTPNLSLHARIAQRQRGLDAALALAQELSKKAVVSESEDELTVELITGRDALNGVIEHVYSYAQHEVLEFDRTPYFNSFEQHLAYVRKTVTRNVRFHTIIDTDALDVPGRMQCARDAAKEGEKIRLYSGVPIKAAIIDGGRMALLLLHLKDGRESGLLLRPSLLLDVLCAHFELLWQQAVPLEDGQASDDRDTNANEMQQIAMLLASGLRDKALANQLGLSERTLQRRISDLQKHLHANSRFQAGWKAALLSLKKR